MLHKHVVAFALLAVVVLEFSFLSQLLNGFAPGLTASVLPSVVEAMTNDQRAQTGAGALAVSPLLTKAAQEKADDMAAKGYFAHVAPDGTEPWHWFDAVGYDYEYAGENLAVNFDDSQQLMQAWMNSPKHRENILKPEYTEIGIGMATGTYQGKETLFVVQFFAKPSPGFNSFAIVATSSSAHESGNVLGAETSRVSALDLVQGSPLTYATYGLILLLAYFVVMLLLSFLAAALPGKRLPHPSVVVNGLAVIVIVLGIIIVNDNGINAVGLPSSDQSASVAAAIQ